MLAIDYALRPVLLSLGAQHVVTGLFVHDKLIELPHPGTDARVRLEGEIQKRLDVVIEDFATSVRRTLEAGSVARLAVG